MVSKEIALFLYGIPGDLFVSPFVVDNFPKLPTDGSLIMQGNLDMGCQKIVNLGNPVDNRDVVHKHYSDHTIVIPRYSGLEYFDLRKQCYIYSLNKNAEYSLLFAGRYPSEYLRWPSDGKHIRVFISFPMLIFIKSIAFTFDGIMSSFPVSFWQLGYYDEKKKITGGCRTFKL